VIFTPTTHSPQQFCTVASNLPQPRSVLTHPWSRWDPSSIPLFGLDICQPQPCRLVGSSLRLSESLWRLCFREGSRQIIRGTSSWPCCPSPALLCSALLCSAVLLDLVLWLLQQASKKGVSASTSQGHSSSQYPTIRRRVLAYKLLSFVYALVLSGPFDCSPDLLIPVQLDLYFLTSHALSPPTLPSPSFSSIQYTSLGSHTLYIRCHTIVQFISSQVSAGEDTRCIQAPKLERRTSSRRYPLYASPNSTLHRTGLTDPRPAQASHHQSNSVIHELLLISHLQSFASELY
jgi:hypothetical protein